MFSLDFKIVYKHYKEFLYVFESFFPYTIIYDALFTHIFETDVTLQFVKLFSQFQTALHNFWKIVVYLTAISLKTWTSSTVSLSDHYIQGR